MHLLLDTNALLWLLAGDERLGPAGRDAAQRADRLLVSVASLWEIAIKVSLRKLGPIPDLHDAIRELGFDRLLICQALVEGTTILTADRVFADYGAAVVDATR